MTQVCENRANQHPGIRRSPAHSSSVESHAIRLIAIDGRLRASNASPLFRYTDLLDIGNYTLRTWGEEQTSRYIDGLEVCCQMLGDYPELGRFCDFVRPGLRLYIAWTVRRILRAKYAGNSDISYSASVCAAGKIYAR